MQDITTNTSVAPSAGSGPDPALQSPVRGAEAAQGPGPEAAKVLVATGLLKRFGGVTALSGVSIEVRAGEVAAVVGDNGAGKSTLMKCVAGAMRPDGGTIEVCGSEVHFRDPREAREVGIEVVYQELALADDLDVSANLFLGREITRRVGPLRILDKRAMHSKAREIIEGFGVNLPSIKVNVRALSGGQRQGVAIGRAVSWGTRLVVMDEPTAALGVRETARIESVIQNLAAQGISVILVSHNLEQVFRASHRIYVLRRGHLVGTRRTAETNGDEIVALITGTKHDEPGQAAG